MKLFAYIIIVTNKNKKENNKMSKEKTYELWLPVYKQGDDFSASLENTKTVSDAFLDLANHYLAAAELCKKSRFCCGRNRYQGRRMHTLDNCRRT